MKIYFWHIFLLIFLGIFDSIHAQQKPSTKDQAYLDRIDSIWQQKNKKASQYNDSKLEELGKNKVEATEEVIRKRLHYLNSQTPMDLRYNTIVRGYIDRHLRYKGSLGELLGRAEHYYPLFEEKLDKYNIPLEIKHLAVVESSLKPTASSRVGAKGLWQFMYQTGLEYDLHSNSYVDDRFDPQKSTEAACQFLSYLYDLFGDWNLALAAYNSGAGNVLKAIRRSGGKRDFWEIRKFLPRETAGYVPAFIAANYIMNFAKAHDVETRYPTYTQYNIDAIEVHKKISFQEISAALDISMEDLVYLNPMYKRKIIPVVPGKKSMLTLPMDKVAMIEKDKSLLYSVASPGQLGVVTKPNNTSTPLNVPKADTSGKLNYHTVRNGETITILANMYKVTPEQIVSWNKLSSVDVYAGNRIKIYTPKSTTQKSNTYKVKKGDNLYRIAVKTNSKMNTLIRLNKLKNANSIHVGQILKLK